MFSDVSGPTLADRLREAATAVDSMEQQIAADLTKRLADAELIRTLRYTLSFAEKQSLPVAQLAAKERSEQALAQMEDILAPFTLPSDEDPIATLRRLVSIHLEAARGSAS